MVCNETLRSMVLGRDFDENLLYDSLIEIFNKLINKHFKSVKSNRQDIEECESRCICKAITLLRSSYIDPTVENLVPFIFTGMRNTISNHIRKKKPIPLEIEDNLLPSHSSDSMTPVIDRVKKIFLRYQSVGIRIKQNIDDIPSVMAQFDSNPYVKAAVLASTFRTIANMS